MQQKQKSLKLNALLNLIKSIMGIIFPLITFPYSSRILMPEGIGKVNFAISIVSFFTMLAALGINSYATRESAKLRDNKIELSKFFKEILILNLISTLFAYLLLFAAIFFVPKFSEYRVLLCICSSSIIMTTLGMEWLFVAKEEFGYITARSIVFQIISLVLLFLLVKRPEDFLWYAFITVVSSVGANLCNLFYMQKFVDFKQKIELKKIVTHIKPIMIFFGMSVVSSVYSMLDTSMIGFFSTDEQVGYYTAAIKINRIVLTALVAITGVLLPRLAFYVEKKDFTNLKLLFNKAIKYILILSIPSTVGLFLLSTELTLLLSGKDYLPSVISMKIINPILIFITISNLIGIQLFTPLGKEKTTLFSVILGAIVNLICNILLIPHYGAMGAAIGTVIAEAIVALFQIIKAREFIFVKEQLKNLLQVVIACCVMAILLIFMLQLDIKGIYGILICIVCGMVSYAVMLFILRNESFFEILNFVKSKLRKRI